jgi:hypothetical protein
MVLNVKYHYLKVERIWVIMNAFSMLKSAFYKFPLFFLTHTCRIDEPFDCFAMLQRASVHKESKE